MNEYPYASQNMKKANFLNVYNEITPHSYFHEMNSIQYRIPDEAKPYLDAVINFISEYKSSGETVRILDFGCSYGVLSAVLKHGLSFQELISHYSAAESQASSVFASLQRDQALLSRRRAVRDLHITGVDRAERAVLYALEAGLLDSGIPHDFEAERLQVNKEGVEKFDLIVSTGCIGYVGEKAFRNLFAVIPNSRPLIACFVLRMFDYCPISDVLSDLGYVTKHFENISLRQRSFSSDTEMQHTIKCVRALGKNTAGKEDVGFLFADLFLSFPAGVEQSKLTGVLNRLRFDSDVKTRES